MATGTAATTARYTHYPVIHEVSFVVNFNDTGIGSGVKVGTLPAGALIIGTDVMIETAFNAATTNVLTVGGDVSTYVDIVAAADVAEGSVALTQNIKPTGSSLGRLAADRPIFAMYTQTGTAATTGVAVVVVKYLAKVG